MISIQEVVTHLQGKILEYRRESKKIADSKECVRQGRNILNGIKSQLKDGTLSSIQGLRSEMEDSVYKISDFFQGLIQKQRKGYEREILQLRSQIERQYKVISNMRKEVEDLQQLIIMQNMTKEKEQSEQQQYYKQKQSQQRVENRPQIPKLPTSYVLQVIEQETQRTVQSSVHSFQDNEHQRGENFIRIEQKSHQQSQQSDQIYSSKNNQGSEQNLAESQLYPKAQDYEQCFSGQSRSSFKHQRNLQSSGFSKRQKTYQWGENSQEPFEKYDSLPLGEGYITGQFNREDNFFDIRRENKQSAKELREITNIMNQCSSEEERQSKTKMFLDQFRKTFNKCLSSANISRKNSAKQTGKKNKSRQDKRKSSRQKLPNTIGKSENQRSSDSQRNFHQMYKETCNSKFSIGSRREQLKYQGDRKQGNKHGNGHLSYSNGLIYEGQFRQNLRHGYGILKFNAIQIYRGQWENDELSGQGKIRNFAVINRAKNLASSSPLLKWVSYCGYFKNNRFEGEGTLYLQGGEKFLGKFICGSACGQGTLFRKNGQIQTGIWRSNELVEKF